MNKKPVLAVVIICLVIFSAMIIYAYNWLTYHYSFDQYDNVKKYEDVTYAGDKINHSEVTLTWDISSNAKSYNLYWSNKPGVTKHSGNKIEDVNPPFKFKEIKKDLTYYFVVTAIYDIEESSESNEVSYRVRDRILP
jgi:hypothetical protein